MLIFVYLFLTTCFSSCEENINDCASSPCKHHGKCIDGVNSYNCTCIPSYTGKNCETYQDPCAPDPCQNGASCLNDSLTGKCCFRDYINIRAVTSPNIDNSYFTTYINLGYVEISFFELIRSL